ncbi:transposase [Streptomyces avermitilis]
MRQQLLELPAPSSSTHSASSSVRASGLRQCRYHGLAKARLQHQLTATAVNFHRLNAWWTDTPKACTRKSHWQPCGPLGRTRALSTSLRCSAGGGPEISYSGRPAKKPAREDASASGASSATWCPASLPRPRTSGAH